MEKLTRKEKEALYKKEARKLLDPEDWGIIEDEFDDSWNPKDWTDEKLNQRLKDAIQQARFNKAWPIIMFIVAMAIVFFIFRLL